MMYIACTFLIESCLIPDNLPRYFHQQRCELGIVAAIDYPFGILFFQLHVFQLLVQCWLVKRDPDSLEILILYFRKDWVVHILNW